MEKKTNKDTITINKKALVGIFCLVPLTAVLLSRNDPAFMVLIIGAVVGTFIGKNLND